MIRIHVHGIPATKGSWNTTKTGKFYPADKKLIKWEADIGYTARRHAQDTPTEIPLRMNLIFFLDNPKRQDIDKLSRAVLDALEGIVYKNDSQIMELQVMKQTDETGHTGVIIEIEELN
jgi:crossover junction endodeoxyribonuclease RusA